MREQSCFLENEHLKASELQEPGRKESPNTLQRRLKGPEQRREASLHPG